MKIPVYFIILKYKEIIKKSKCYKDKCKNLT